MSFLTLYSEVRGSVAKLPVSAAKKFTNRAWEDVRRKNLWSFQLYDGPQWISPPNISSGLAAVTQGSPNVTMDATATTALNAGSTLYSLITQRQFRVAAGTIYNIIAWDNAGALVLDRPYGEATSTGTAYQLYQVYYAAPYSDHITFISVRDMQNFNDLDLSKNRAYLDSVDPQRSWFTFPTTVVSYQQDQNPNSSTYQYPMYELWGQPQYNLNYQLYGIRFLPDLVNNADTLPPAITDDVIIAKAKFYAYQWAEANKGDMPRNQGSDFKFLMQETTAEYKDLVKRIAVKDRETVSQWVAVRRLSWSGVRLPYYSTLSGFANPNWGFGY